MSNTCTQHGPERALEQRLAECRQGETTLSTVQAIFKLDPHGREDLAAYAAALNDAQDRNDQEAVACVLEALEELFRTGYNTEEETTLEKWERNASQNERFAKAWKARKRENREFLARYEHAKATRGISSQREMAEAAGLSINTICAIETEKVKPQTKTVQKLAEALGVDVEWLLGGESLEPNVGPG